MTSLPNCSSVVNASPARGPVYLASPKPTFGTERHDRMLAQARSLFPAATVVPASGMFTSDEDWRARWAAVVASLSALVFFTEEDGTIGMGVSQEVDDARAEGVPVHFLADDGRLWPDEAFELLPHPRASARFFEIVALAGG